MQTQIVLAASAPSVAVLDYNTATTLASWKPASASSSQLTAVMPTQNGLGGFFLSAQPDKPLLHAFAFQKDQMLFKIVLPEKLSAIAIDPSARYCAGGTHTGRIFLWEIASGLLLNAFDAHYRQVTVLRFSSDRAILCSGSEDSGIAVWSLSRLVDNSTQLDAPQPYCTFTDHTLAITDLYCGVGAFPTLRLFSSSADGSVKLWDLAARELLVTFSFAGPISHLAVDPAERVVFAAASGDSGVVHQVDLYSYGPARHSARAVAGAGDTVHLSAAEDEKNKNARSRIFSLGKSVTITSLALDLPALQLLVGASDGTVSIFDIVSHQLLRSFSPIQGGGPVTFLWTGLRPVDLLGPSTSTTAKEKIPLSPIVPFHRIRDRAAREVHEVPMMLPKQALPELLYDTTAILADHAQWMQADSGNGNGTDDVGVLAAEVARLREQLAEAKSLNDAMWEAAVNAALVPAGETNGRPTSKRARLG